MDGHYILMRIPTQYMHITLLPEICVGFITTLCFTLFLGFTRTFFSNSEWGSTQNVLMIVLRWSKQISRNCTHLLPNTRSTHTVKFFSVWWQCIDLKLTPSEIYDVTWNPRIIYLCVAITCPVKIVNVIDKLILSRVYDQNPCAERAITIIFNIL